MAAPGPSIHCSPSLPGDELDLLGRAPDRAGALSTMFTLAYGLEPSLEVPVLLLAPDF